MTNHTVTVVGSGYVGTTTAALLAAIGIKTFALDIDEKKLDLLRSGKAPFYEAGLDSLVKHGIDSGLLTPTNSYEEAIVNSNIVMSAVGTPDSADGSPNLEYVYSALAGIAEHAKGNITYVQKSTVPVGTGLNIIEKFAELSDQKFSYVSAPEFLREGTAVVDSIEPDRIVVGSHDADTAQRIAQIFLDIYAHREAIAQIADQELVGRAVPRVFHMSVESAELTKVTANAFLALKISFANSIAKLADATDADVVEVMDAVGADKRIGRAFLNAGRGYGGGCFPKDVVGLISSAQQHGVSMDIMTAASNLNESMPGYIVEQLGEVRDQSVAVLGLSFKAGTSDVRKSPGVKLANLLHKEGARVLAYDPEANGEAKEDLDPEITLTNSAQEAIDPSMIIVIATEWPEFRELDFNNQKEKLIFDAMNLLDPEHIASHDIQYKGVGRKVL